ncbi:MAG: hypothetical protein HUJ42_00400 [Malacoplasma sp.]|nr:hypothetical protein [Malacoplasma sp.]
MKYKCFPKVNLFLLIGKKDKILNLHKIKSLFFRVEDTIYDEVEIDFCDNKNQIKYFDNKNQLLLIKDCIFLKAIKLLKQNNLIDSNTFFKITINKKIPLFSGVGGASSDVASLFKFLLNSRILKWNKKLEKTILQTGSDVMFFVKDFQVAKVMGFGDKVKKINLINPIKIKLYFNNIACDTKQVYKHYESLHNTNHHHFQNSYKKQILYFKIKKYSLLENNLKESAFILYSDLKNKYKELQKILNTNLFLSGTGSTFFTID